MDFESETSNAQNDPDKEESKATRCSSFLKEHSGIFYGMISGLARAGAKMIGKDLTFSLTPSQILVLHAIFQGFIAISLKPILKQDLHPISADVKYFVYGCTIHSVSVLLCYVALSYVDYYECMVVMFGTLAASSIFVAKCILSEPVSRYKICSAIIICFGIFMTFQPNIKFNHFDNWSTYIGLIAAIAAGVSGSVGGSVNRMLNGSSPLAIVFYCSISNIVFGGIVCLFQFQKGFYITWEDTGKSFLLSFLGVVILGSFAKGTQVANLVEVCLAMEIDIPAGLILQIIVFHETPKLISIFGGMVVLIGIISILLEQYMMKKIHHCISKNDNLDEIMD